MGGGAIRAAARFGAGCGVLSGGLRRGSPDFNPSTAARPVPAGMNSSSSQLGSGSVGDVERPCREADGWVFAGEEEVVGSVSGEPVARTVFGPTATKLEAEEATSELKEALEQVYLSSPDSTGWIPSTVGWIPTLSALSNSEHSDAKPHVTCQTVITDSAPNTALQAFKMLSESTTAQSVVASIACDQNVWNAVLGNPALVDFLESQKTAGTRFQDMDADFVADSDPEFSDFSPKPENSTASSFADLMESFKHKVFEMVSNASCILHGIFGTSKEDRKEEEDGNGKDLSQAAPFLGLAVLVIMVVLLKRG